MLTVGTKYLEHEEVDALADIAVMFGSETIEDAIVDCVQFCYQVAQELGENGSIIIESAQVQLVK